MSPAGCTDFHKSILYTPPARGIFILVILIALVIVLGVGSYFDNKRSRLVIICKLINRYKEDGSLEIDLPATCKRRFRKLEQRERLLSCSIIYYFIEKGRIRKNQQMGELYKEDIEKGLINSDLFHGDEIDAKC